MTDIYRAKKINIPEEEIYRYLGYRGNEPDENVKRLIRECVEELDSAGDYRACRERLPAAVCDGGVMIQNTLFPGKGLAGTLEGCSEAFAFAATIGPAADRKMSALRYTQPAKALIMDAVCSAAVEAFCDKLNAEWETEAAAEGKFLKRRFSPGYGDLPITVQKDLLRILDAAHLAGITLSGAMMMIPRKSVSAIIGISSCPEQHASGCASCRKMDCAYRKTGMLTEK